MYAWKSGVNCFRQNSAKRHASTRGQGGCSAHASSYKRLACVFNVMSGLLSSVFYRTRAFEPILGRAKILLAISTSSLYRFVASSLHHISTSLLYRFMASSFHHISTSSLHGIIISSHLHFIAFSLRGIITSSLHHISTSLLYRFMASSLDHISRPQLHHISLSSLHGASEITLSPTCPVRFCNHFTRPR